MTRGPEETPSQIQKNYKYKRNTNTKEIQKKGGESMKRGPDETPSPLLALGFLIRPKEPNVELLLKTNLNEVMKRSSPT